MPIDLVVELPLVNQVRKLMKAAVFKFFFKVTFRILSVSVAPAGNLLFQMLLWSSTNYFTQSGFLQRFPAIFCLLKTGKRSKLSLEDSQIK